MFIFTTFLVIKLLITPDFGISVDEPIQRNHRLVNFKQIVTTFKLSNLLPKHLENLPDLQNYPHRFYGVATQLPLVFMEFNSFFDYQNRVHWYIAHFFTHGMFLVSGFLLFKSLLNLRINKHMSLLITILYFLHPRIYANSFYNIKDSLFLSMFTINIFFLIKAIAKQSYKNIILLSIFSAFLTNIRLVGGILPALAALYIFLFSNHSLKHRAKLFFLLSTISLSIFPLITPVLWENTFDNLTSLIGLSASYNRWNGLLVFNGDVIKGNNIPFYYLPVWIAITTPVAYLVIWILALASYPFIVQDKNYPLDKRILSE